MTPLSEFDAASPQEESLVQTWQGFVASLDAEAPEAERLAILDTWDRERRRFATWRSFTSLRFSQDTQDPERRANRAHCDRLQAQVSGLDAEVKRRFLGLLPSAALEARAGAQTLACWKADAAAEDPDATALREQEQKRQSDYTALLGGARIPFRGEEKPMPAMGPHLSASDRAEREEAQRAVWTWFAAQADELDAIYDDLVGLRARIAKDRGLDSFVELGYLRMQRVDYDRRDVERFRAAVREHVVPLASTLIEARRQRLGLDAMMLWDEGQAFAQGNPRPLADPAGLRVLGQQAFDALHPEVGAFFRGMVEQDLMDLEIRDGKAGGGFCTFLPDLGVPFIFANCAGTHHDVRVLVHEAGHAFQMYSSRGMDLLDKIFPTYEACEVHSMGLEFLAWPQTHVFFGDDAARYQRLHLEDALLFLPYGVLVDHFQHEVYDNPGWSPDERAAAWSRLEAEYMPWRNNGDLPHVDRGRYWQRQAHIFGMPFYYIDYTLAQTCALQFWSQGQKDHDEAMERYVALCKRGGTQPFQALARGAGLTSPFDEGCLAEVVADASRWLDANPVT